MPTRNKSKNNSHHDDGESDHEAFDLNVSDMSSSDGEAPPAVVTTAKTNPPTSTPEHLPAPLLDPLLLPSAPTAGLSNRAHDINYFFTCGSKTDGSLTICKQCKWVNDFILVFLLSHNISAKNKSITHQLSSRHSNSNRPPVTRRYASILKVSMKKNTWKFVHRTAGRTNYLGYNTVRNPVLQQWRSVERVTQRILFCRKSSTGL